MVTHDPVVARAARRLIRLTDGEVVEDTTQAREGEGKGAP